MPKEMEIPETTLERMEKNHPGKGKMLYPADSPKWFDRKLNEEAAAKELWSTGYDPRFPQTNMARGCWTYYVDYHRCLTLKGQDYAPCKYFQNSYQELCPKFWTEKWDQWVEENRFPAHFDR